MIDVVHIFSLRRYDSYEEYQHERLKREEYRLDYEKREFERAEQREKQRQKAIVSQLKSHFPCYCCFFSSFFCCLFNLFSFTVADKRAHVISNVTQRPPTDTHTDHLGWDSLKLRAMCQSISPPREYIQSEFLNDSGDRPFLFLFGLGIFNISVVWKLCQLVLITPQGLKQRKIENSRTRRREVKKGGEMVTESSRFFFFSPERRKPHTVSVSVFVFYQNSSHKFNETGIK